MVWRASGENVGMRDGRKIRVYGGYLDEIRDLGIKLEFDIK